jgi:hypothetical protein
MIMGGITMAVGLISLRLQNLGVQVMANVLESARVLVPKKPVSAHLMRFFNDDGHDDHHRLVLNAFSSSFGRARGIHISLPHLAT